VARWAGGARAREGAEDSRGLSAITAPIDFEYATQAADAQSSSARSVLQNDQRGGPVQVTPVLLSRRPRTPESSHIGKPSFFFRGDAHDEWRRIISWDFHLRAHALGIFCFFPTERSRSRYGDRLGR
jgi:hypothetical protein